MPAADRKQHQGADDREPEDGSLGCELRPFAHPVSDALVLAAAKRAEHHKPRSSPGVMLRDVFAHMGFLYNGAATRQLRPRLDALLSADALEQTRRHGVKLWVLTSTGRRRLAQARRKGEAVALPESPQHRTWRHSRATAAERIEGYREELRALLDEADALLDAGTRAHSDSWFRLAKRLPVAAKGIAGVPQKWGTRMPQNVALSRGFGRGARLTACVYGAWAAGCVAGARSTRAGRLLG